MKKSIVLNDIQPSNKKAVLSLEEDGIGIKGTLRLYNFAENLPGISSLGFYVDKKVYKAGLTLKSPMLYEFFISLEKIPTKFTCAVVNFQNAQSKPILYGSSQGSCDDLYASIIGEISKDNSLANTQNVLDKYNVDFDDEEKAQVEKEIDNALFGGNCENCIYKAYFYENNDKKTQISANLTELDKKEEKKEIEEVDVFFDKLKPQIDKLFENNPVEENLQALIPSSKFVKVDFEDDGDFYVFGLLYDEEGNVKFVCYGVPAVFEEEPPKELSGYPVWLPLDEEKRDGFGYWLTYQDASTGEPVKAILQ